MIRPATFDYAAKATTFTFEFRITYSISSVFDQVSGATFVANLYFCYHDAKIGNHSISDTTVSYGSVTGMLILTFDTLPIFVIPSDIVHQQSPKMKNSCASLLLIFAFSNLLSSQCDLVSVNYNKAFEENRVIFKQHNNRGHKEVNLFDVNPYSNIGLTKVGIDPVYGMMIYEVDINSNKHTSILKKIFPGQTIRNSTITRFNSLADVAVLEDCYTKIVFAAYGFDNQDQILAYTTTTYVYNEQGERISAVGGRIGGDNFSVLSFDKKYLLSISNNGRLVDQPNMLWLTNLSTLKTEISLSFCPNEILSCAAIKNSNKIFAEAVETDSSGELRTDSYYIFDTEKKKMYYKSFGKDEASKSVSVLEDRLVPLVYKGLEKKTVCISTSR